MMNFHPFHLTTLSPWPIYSAMNMMFTMLNLIFFINFNNSLILLSFMSSFMIMFQWWRDIIRESTFQGFHTKKVSLSLKLGMILFITSEIFFFLSFFWSFFHSSLTPTHDIFYWPPYSIIPFNPFQIPLLNTIILLTSGLSVTTAHHFLLKNNFTQTKIMLIITMTLGMYFSILQLFEYLQASFTLSDSIFGSTFFMSTGFHGLHVLIGTLFLMIITSRHFLTHFSNSHHLGFEFAAWYWHFVDVVWLFLFITIYWWSN